MQKIKTVLLVSSSRADYSYIHPLHKRILENKNFNVRLLIVDIKLPNNQDVYFDNAQADKVIQIFSDTSRVSISRNFSDIQNTLFGFLVHENPDLVILLGDRYETMAIAIACYLARIPIAHLAGGDVTVGSLDDGFRNAISAISSLHFPTNLAAYNRLIANGIPSNCVFNVGSTSLDNISEHTFDPQIMRMYFDDSLELPVILATFHPVTTEPDQGLNELEALLKALDGLGDTVRVIFTGSNGDELGNQFNLKVKAFCAQMPTRRRQILNAGREAYLDLMHKAALVCGNSSSGIYEAPYLETQTLNIGNRQTGRPFGSSVISVSADYEVISQRLNHMIANPITIFDHYFGSFGASERIIQILSEMETFSSRNNF